LRGAQYLGELAFKIKSSAPFYKVANAYCKTKGINPSSVRFHSDGVRLVNDKTIAEVCALVVVMVVWLSSEVALLILLVCYLVGAGAGGG
jgi:hypothetical protein